MLLLALIGTGCGRGDGEAFREDSLRPLQERLARERARVAATLRVVRRGNARDARALGEDVEALAATVRRIGGLVPPGEARDEFGAYVDALGDLIGELRELERPLRQGDGAVLTSVSAQIQDASGAVQERTDALEQALEDV